MKKKVAADKDRIPPSVKSKWLVSSGSFSHEVEALDPQVATLEAFRTYEIPESLGWVICVQEWSEAKKKFWRARYVYTGHILSELGITYVDLKRPSRIMITGGAVEKVAK